MLKKYLKIIFSFFFLVLLFSPLLTRAEDSKWVPPSLQISIPGIIKFSTPTQCGTQNGQPVFCVPWLGEYISAIFKYGVGIIGIVAAIAMMIGGVRWLTAGGNAASVKDAQGWITGAITGLILALASYLILNQINPNLVNLKPIKVVMVSKAPAISNNRYTNCSWKKGYTEEAWKTGDNCPGQVKTGDENCEDKGTNGVGEVCCCDQSALPGCSWQATSCDPDKQEEKADKASAIDSCGTSNTNYHCCCSKVQKRGCQWSNDSTCGSNSMQVSNPGSCDSSVKGYSTCCCPWGCQPVSYGACSPEQLQQYGFNCGDVSTASAVCQGESRGDIRSKSGIDKCSDGYSFSLGLFQINVVAHANRLKNIPSSCKGIFSGTGKSNCKMIGTPAQYNQCVNDITDPATNIKLACELVSGSGWSNWSYYNKNCQ